MLPHKWRPTIGMITAAAIASVLVLPLVGLVFFRLFENQLVRQTEGELIAQAAVISSAYAQAVERDGDDESFPVGAVRPAFDPAIAADERFASIAPSLDLAVSAILPARPSPTWPETAVSERALAVGSELSAITQAAQRTTLAGFRLLDANGVVIGGGGDIGFSFAHVEEVRAALDGRFQSVMRVRNEEEPPPPIYSISRGTKVRIFVAMPVFVADRVRGVVYMSRTPDNILRQLYRERAKVAGAVFLVVLAALAIGAVFVRTIVRPMRELTARAADITNGRQEAIGPLRRHGTQEIASLTENFMTMAKRLSERSDYLSNFANHVSHELKTPVTAIRGAAELMRDADTSMTPEERERFLSNVLADTERISALLDRLREMARADNPQIGGETSVRELLDALRVRFSNVKIELAPSEITALPLSPENAQIVFGHLIDNAERHGASRIDMEIAREESCLHVRVRDNGVGVSPGNRERVFDPFFTTRREAGGTGMGLGIVRALLRAHGGDIALDEGDGGACFTLTLPVRGERA